ncbi:helix-turn-helix domain-containing protein [Geomonas edaphica]|uniref:helix-turn-helix domain-containing protein n=1 Tax=Geomonas edaphica TaxID=2570226 RepID=UPI001FE589EF|nr:helix-turn-helix domain-containing protein [Geomonas edaphica]
MKKRQVVQDAAYQPAPGTATGCDRFGAGGGGQCIVLQRLFSCRNDAMSTGAEAGHGADVGCSVGAMAFASLTLREARDRIERWMVYDAIRACAGNMSKAADMLGVSRPALYDLVKKYGVCRIKTRG